ncbi:hydantoinase/carbamoylase family amidase [Sutterella sp.]|uniref:hydantoinase/carbamoylase family amidase n=1 Tax=Sutterella sp. TaxID=1981025 RepID=UPI003FD7C9CD
MTEKTFDAVCGPRVEKLFADVRALSHSAAPLTGVTRIGYTPVEDRVVEYLADLGRSLGLEVEIDPAGDVWMTLPGKDRSLPAVVSGSHADSVVNGGNYDGMAGIVAALCPVFWLKALGVELRRDYRVLVIRCEEQGLIGTKGILGILKPEDLDRRFDGAAVPLREALLERGLDPKALTGGRPLIDLSKIAAFFEAHIEQSKKLDGSKTKRVGLVTGIRGIRVHRAIRAHGVQAHAGAIDYPFRRDAVAASARFISKVHDAWEHELSMGRDLVVTTGAIRTPDTAMFNVIAGECTMTLDMRSLEDETFARFSKKIDRILDDLTEETGVAFTMDPPALIAPNHSDAKLVERLKAAAARLSIGVQEMPSGAGHDAANFGAAGIPFAMLFIANQEGSHNPREAMRTDDFLAAAHILTDAVMHFDD